MAAPVPTSEPLEIFAGDSIHFTKALANFPAPTWVLSYRLLSQKGQIELDIPSTASGTGFDVTVTRSTTATWTAGSYTLFGLVVSGDERVRVYCATFTVKPDPAVVHHFDARTYLQLVLEKLEEVILNGIVRETFRYSYGGVTSEIVSLKDALDARDRIKAAILQEEAVASGKNRRILTKFVTPR